MDGKSPRPSVKRPGLRHVLAANDRSLRLRSNGLAPSEEVPDPEIRRNRQLADETTDLQIRRKMGYLVEGAVRARAKPGPKPHEGLDESDVAILRALNQDARKSYRELAKELGLALSTVSARVKRLEAQGYVTGYVPVLDPVKLGFDLVVIVGVKITHGKLLEAQKRIAKIARVFGVYDVTGDWDSIVLARFRDREELNEFVKDLLALPYVERTGTQLVLNTVKEEKRVLF